MTEIERAKTFWKRSSGEIITYTEGTLMDIIQLARRDILSLLTTIESLQGDMEAAEIVIKSYREEVESQKEEIETLRRQMNEYLCFVCEVENKLNEPRGTQSHPINCAWRLKEEYKIMEEELKKDGKILFWSESENRPKIAGRR